MSIIPTIKQYGSLVKFAHTVFALPFALVAFLLALREPGARFTWVLLLQLLGCMVFARSAAMGFNRWADREIDAKNPRTAGRDIPSGRISPRQALIYTLVNAAYAWYDPRRYTWRFRAWRYAGYCEEFGWEGYTKK